MSEHTLIEDVRRACVDVNHALMVLDMPTTGAGKRAWASLVDAKQVLERAIERAEVAERLASITP